MPITSTKSTALPVMTGNDLISTSLRIDEKYTPKGVTASAQIIAQHYRQAATADAGGNFNPMKIGAPAIVQIPDVYSTMPADAGGQHNVAALATSIQTAIQTATAAGVDLQATLATVIGAAVQAFVTAKGL